MKNLGMWALQGPVREYDVSSENELYSSYDGALFTKNLYTLILVPNNYVGQEFSIPDATHIVGYRAFDVFCQIEYVRFGANVDSLGYANRGNGWYDEEPTGFGGNYVSPPLPSTGILEMVHLQRIFVDARNPYYSTQGNFLLADEGKVLLRSFGTHLEEIEIPSSVTIIEGDAFLNHNNLRRVIFHDGVTEIRHRAFGVCINLDNVTLPSGLRVLDDLAFMECASLSHIEIPDGVTRIGDGAFFGCASLRQVTLPTNLETIEHSAFFGCVRLYSISLPASLTQIGLRAFEDCTSLVEVVNGSSLEITSGSMDHGWVGLYAKSIVSNAEESRLSVDVNGNVLYQDGEEVTFITTSKRATTANIPQGVTSIHDYAFYHNDDLTSVIVPDSVTHIGAHSFEGCGHLESMTLPFIGESRGSNSFFGYIFGADQTQSQGYYVPKSLTHVILTGEMTAIPEFAFYTCGNIESVTLPDTITSIERWAFTSCLKLRQADLPEGLLTIGEDAFFDCAFESVVVPKSVQSIGCNAFNCPNLHTLTVPFIGGSRSENQFIGYILHGGVPVQQMYIHNLREVIINDDITSVPQEAFMLIDSLQRVSLPDTVASIGARAFSSCTGLVTMTLPSSLTEIADEAFYGCTSLAEVINLSALPIVVGSNAYGEVAYYALRVVNGPAESAFSVLDQNYLVMEIDGKTRLVSYFGEEETASVPSGITNVHRNAFSQKANLKTIIFPDSVKAIESLAIYNCPELLDVQVPNSLEQVDQDPIAFCEKYAYRTYEGAKYLGNSSNPYVALMKVADLELRNITIPHGCRYIGTLAFDGSAITQITVPSSVVAIGFGAFSNCGNLESMTLPFIGGGLNSHNYLSYIFGGYSPEDGCTKPAGLTQLVITAPTLSISQKAFMYWSNVTSIRFTGVVTSIGDQAFYACTSLTGLEFATGLTMIGSNAFEMCSSIDKIELPSTLISIGDRAFASMYQSFQVIYGGSKAEWDAIGKGNNITETESHGELLCDGESYPLQ